jgi:hypothetical protein
MRTVWRIVWRLAVVVGASSFVFSGVRLLGRASGRCKHVVLGRRYFMIVNTCYDAEKWSSTKAVRNTGWAMSGTAAGWLSITLGMLGLGVVVVGLKGVARRRPRRTPSDDETVSPPRRLDDALPRRAPAHPPSAGTDRVTRSDTPSDTPAHERDAAITVAITAGQDLAARLASSLDHELPTAVKHAAILVGTMIEVGSEAVRMHPSGVMADSELAKLAALAEANGLPGERIARLIRERKVSEAVAAASAALLRVAALHQVELPEEVAMQLPLWLTGS